MSATLVQREGEQGSVRRLGAGYGEICYDLTASGGTTSLADQQTPFVEIESVIYAIVSPAGAVGSFAIDATDKSKVDLTFTANTVAVVYIRGRGM